jgi:antitoxin (DNA-binding transcriptional repressor) of toxin-antitoxin stability system
MGDAYTRVHMPQTRIGTRELRGDLATHLRRAASGQRIVVTAGGRPMALLGPVEDAVGAETIDALVAAGALVPPRRTDPARLGAPVAVWSGVRLDRAFGEVRG